MGSEKKQKERSEIAKKDQWDIEAMYGDEKQWGSDCREVEQEAKDFERYAGRLGESAKTLLAAMKAADALELKAQRVYVYARMRRDEDSRKGASQTMCDQAMSLMAMVGAHQSFFTPEILEISEDKLMSFMEEEKELQLYRYLFERILREKAHVLSREEEKLLAQFGELTPVTNEIFGMINNADMKFGTVTDQDGDAVELTHGNYVGFLESENPQIRREAYEKMYEAYEKQKNTLAATYSYNTKTDAVLAKIRSYPSAAEAALSGDNVPLSVYQNLVETVHESLPIFHRYLELRKKVLKLDQLHMYDVYVPLVSPPAHGRDIPYERALDMVREGLAPMGEDYLNRMNRGLSQRWIDVYENQGKRSGAYSFGSYDSYPYILMNYTGRLDDVFTIIHEMGHSMHSCYTRATQPFVYGSHSIFTAEVASTVNESLLMKHLIAKATDPQEKMYLIDLYIEKFRGTLFRQTMFAEFELLTHQAVEEGQVLTADWLCHRYGKLNQEYFGETMEYDDYIPLEWARIPHFYNAFYVYQYATGFSAATALSKKILDEGAPARDRYIEFLKTGNSDDPIKLLKLAGVDMSSPEPIRLAMATFQGLVEELEKWIGSANDEGNGKSVKMDGTSK